MNDTEEKIQAPKYIGDWIRWSYCKKYLKRDDGEKLLDVGAGACEYKPLVESKGYRYYAIDIDSKSPAKKGDICKIPFDDEEFGVVLCFDVLEHVKDDQKAVKEIHRVMKNDGILILHVPNKHQRHILIEKPEEQDDHVRIGYDPVELHTLFYDFQKMSYYPTFDKLESVAWDLFYAINHKIPINPWNIINNENWCNYGWILVCRK